jgi:hypothetical protein
VAESFRATEVVRVRRNRRWLALGASPFLLGLGFVVAALVTGYPLLMLPLVHASIFGTLGLSWAYQRNKSPVLVPGELSVDDAGVHHAGALVARRDELEQGFLVDDGARSYVRLKRKGLKVPLTFETRDADQGRAILQALGFDVTQRAAEMRAASDLFAWSLLKQLVAILGPMAMFLLPAVFGAAATNSPIGVALAVPLFVVYVFTLLLAPTRLRIGVDGVVTRWLGRETFVPFARVTDVRGYRHRSGNKIYFGVELALDGGETVRIPCGQEGWSTVARDEIMTRIQDALDVHRRTGTKLDPALLARHGRDTGGWVRALRGIGAGANAGMRTPPIAPERLLDVVEDPAAPAVARVGAAVAVLPSMPTEARNRVRIAAEKTASPPLRRALERVLEAERDDAAAAEALAELEAAEAAAELTART